MPSSKKRRRGPSSTASKKDLTPSDTPEARTPRDKKLLPMTCQYLGKTFYEGAAITHKDVEWRCHQGKWIKTEEVNPNHLAAAQTPEDRAALQVTCQAGDKIFYGGDKVCFQSVEFQCTANGWVKTGNSC